MFLYYPEIFYNKFKHSLFGNRSNNLKEEDFINYLSKLKNLENFNKNSSFYITNCYLKEYDKSIVKVKDQSYIICKNHTNTLLDLKISFNYANINSNSDNQNENLGDCLTLKKCFSLYKNQIPNIFIEETVIRCAIEEEHKIINTQSTSNKVNNIDKFIQKKKNDYQKNQYKDFKDIRNVLTSKYSKCLNN